MLKRLSLVEDFWHSSFEEDGEVVERLFPLWDGHRPFLRGFEDGHVDQLQCRVTVRVLFSVAGELADHTVHRFDHVRGVGRFADCSGQVEHRNDVRPLRRPLFGDRGIFLVPAFAKRLQSLFGFQHSGRLVDAA